jgi:hypothetical protein
VLVLHRPGDGGPQYSDPTGVPALGIGTGDPNFSFNTEPFAFAPARPGEATLFDITWASSDGNLAIALAFEGPIWDFHLGDNGGEIGSDDWAFGCGLFADCTVAGFWSDPSGAVPVPTPSPLALLATGLAGFAALRRGAARA